MRMASETHDVLLLGEAVVLHQSGAVHRAPILDGRTPMGPLCVAARIHDISEADCTSSGFPPEDGYIDNEQNATF